MKKRNIRLLAAIIAIIAIFTSFGSLSCGATGVTDGTNFYELGDCNKDNAINIKDLVRIKRNIAENYEILVTAADVNCDGSITAEDLVVMKKHLLGIGSLGAASDSWITEIN